MAFAVFRADASPAVGGGHVMRCLALAEALTARGWICAFACNTGAARTIPALAASRHEVWELTNNDAATPAALQRRWPAGAELLTVDHYGLDAAYESACRPWAARILVIDDLASRDHDADLLLDQAPGRSDADYRGRVPPPCRLMLGTDYALLRPQFAGARADALRKRRERKVLRRVLVSLGATDPDNVTGQVLDVIHGREVNLGVDVILGAGTPHREAIARQLQVLPPPSALHVDPTVETMIRLMAAADLAIGAGGISAWERCCLGLPALILLLADNQRANVLALARAGAASATKVNELPDRIRELTANPAALGDMSTAAASLCDGGGCERVARVLDITE
ncbi:MAG: UDP-2,4-diacetamido-2,4,6-trideoxy-beta-L-altropyranose hydrolase [Gammaproteobacteria bacterium]